MWSLQLVWSQGQSVVDFTTGRPPLLINAHWLQLALIQVTTGGTEYGWFYIQPTSLAHYSKPTHTTAGMLQMTTGVVNSISDLAAHLEQKCKPERAKSLFKTKPLHHKYSISLSVVCFRVYLSTIFEFSPIANWMFQVSWNLLYQLCLKYKFTHYSWYAFRLRLRNHRRGKVWLISPLAYQP